jgi:hypothetical protein
MPPVQPVVAGSPCPTPVRAGRITLAQLRDAPTSALDPAQCLGEQVAAGW